MFFYHVIYTCSATTPLGLGGAALLFSKQWTIKTAWSLSPRILYVERTDADGITHPVLSAHFHHDAILRLEQWKVLSALHTDLPPNLITLSDHNFVVLPARDKAFHSPHPEHKCVIQVREAETLCMFQLNLVDSYVSMHGGWADDHPQEGFTYAFASGTPQAVDPDFAQSPEPDLHIKDRRRRIVRILIPYAYQPSHFSGFF